MGTLSTTNRTRQKLPRVAFSRAHELALPAYDVSLVFVTEREAQKLNVSLRKKTYVPNVLSYLAGEKHGEIIICTAEAKRQADSFSLSYPDFLLFLFIHGLLHLKGRRHSSIMEREERELLARIVTRRTHNETKTRHRDRHRDASNKSRRRRGS